MADMALCDVKGRTDNSYQLNVLSDWQELQPLIMFKASKGTPIL